MDLSCTNCKNEKLSYSAEYDSYYCDHCNMWIEDICTDRDCEFCKHRPERPNEESKL
jgi:hypothetical protein